MKNSTASFEPGMSDEREDSRADIPSLVLLGATDWR